MRAQDEPGRGSRRSAICSQQYRLTVVMEPQSASNDWETFILTSLPSRQAPTIPAGVPSDHQPEREAIRRPAHTRPQLITIVHSHGGGTNTGTNTDQPTNTVRSDLPFVRRCARRARPATERRSTLPVQPPVEVRHRRRPSARVGPGQSSERVGPERASERAAPSKDRYDSRDRRAIAVTTNTVSRRAPIEDRCDETGERARARREMGARSRCQHHRVMPLCTLQEAPNAMPNPSQTELSLRSICIKSVIENYTTSLGSHLR